MDYQYQLYAMQYAFVFLMWALIVGIVAIVATLVIGDALIQRRKQVCGLLRSIFR